MIDAEDSYFIDCYRAVEFMKYNEVNKSKFTNCTFTDNGQNNLGGVSIWDTDGIVFDNCTFEEMGYGILVYDAGCTVRNGCVFSNNDKGIAVRATSPVPSGSPVVIAPEGGGRNTFGPSNAVDIEINSGDLYKSVEIFENDFLGYNNYSSIWVDGRSTVRIRENDFGKADFTVFVENTDVGFVDIFCNNFHSNSFIPTYFRGRNDRTTIRANNFNDNYTGNITIDGDAGPSSIAPSQGWFNDPAKNCFSAISNEHIWTFGNTDEFDYFVPIAPSNCEEPAQASYGANNFEVYYALENLIHCPFLEEEEVHDFQDYLSKRNEYLNILALYQSNPNDATLIAQLLEAERGKWMVMSSLSRGL